MALITQANLEKHLQITFGTDPDPVVAELIGQAQAAAEAWCRQPLEYAATVTETFEATQPDAWHVVERFPVTAVTSVTETGTVLTVTDQYVWYDDGRLRRVNGDSDASWAMTVDAVTVVYAAGYGTGAPAPYDTVPQDLVLGIVHIAAALFRNGVAFAKDGAVPVKSITLDGSDSLEFAVDPPGSEPPFISGTSKTLLAPYRRRRL